MRIAYGIAACALGAGLCAAQTAGWQKTTDVVTFQNRVQGGTGAVEQLRAFVTMEMAGGKVVTGAPYSAQSVSEFEQTLGDGNRIVRSNSGMVYRDSEGRTRREQSMGGMGLLAPAANLPPLVIITDPVAGFSYVLNAQEKTATKTTFLRGARGIMPMEAPSAGAMAVAGMASSNVVYVNKMGGTPQSDNTRTESLGTRMFDGVAAEGTRTTTTIPAGQIGNERPIEVVSERWYSPQLQVVVLSQHSDPRTGTNTERLSGITLADPSRSLFEIPADYTIRDGPGPVNIMRVEPSKK